MTENKESASGSEVKLLIVDDDETNRRLLEMISIKCGITPRLATNGQEAIWIYDRDPFDVIFMDLRMPEINGFDATLKIREIERTKKTHRPAWIVGLSADGIEKNREACLEVGMNDFMTKPYSLDKIKDIVSQVR